VSPRGSKPQKPPPLALARDRAESVKGKVEEAADELSSVNGVLQQELGESAPKREVAEAMQQSVGVEAKVQECAQDLEVVASVLSDEILERARLSRQVTDLTAALGLSQTVEKATRHEAMHDPLTGLPNLTLFGDRLKQGLAQARRHGWRLAVLFIDLDGFKGINDGLGHAVGDRVLKVVGQRLRSGIRAGDTVCRRSGDEFLVLLLEAGDETTIARLAAMMRAAVAEPLGLEGAEVSVQMSIGIAVFPEDGAAAEELLERADVAMYAAKRAGRGIALYSEVPAT